MNCQPGDLAVVARATAENIVPHLGRVVQCIALAPDDCWSTEPELEIGRAVYDGALKPIRDQPGADETLAWVPVPAKPEEVPA